MLLQKLLEGIPYKMLQGTDGAEIKMPVYDSRKVQPGDLFVCVAGFRDRQATAIFPWRWKKVRQPFW